jgi:hypothetical protein
MQEKLLYQHWAYYSQTQEKLTSHGNTLQICNSGRLNLNKGPDFQSAEFILNGVAYCGAVELHSESAHWYSHRHHLDKSYNDVLLHISGANRSGEKTVRAENGKKILNFILPAPNVSLLRKQCQLSQSPPQNILSQLAGLGFYRLVAKSQLIRRLKTNYHHSVLFNSYLLRVLGYPSNQSRFQQLAFSIPTAMLMIKNNDDLDNFNRLYALFAGQAGFLNDRGLTAYGLQLKQIYQSIKPVLDMPSFHTNDWIFSGVRPLNHPHFRLAGWVRLLLNANCAPYSYFKTLFQQRLSPAQLYGFLLAELRFKSSGYWKTRFSLNTSHRSISIRNFFSVSRINELLINAIIPYFYAEEWETMNWGYTEYLLDFYSHIRSAAPYNSLKRYQPFIFETLATSKTKKAIHWQGFIHLIENYCNLGNCKECPLLSKAPLLETFNNASFLQATNNKTEKNNAAFF